MSLWLNYQKVSLCCWARCVFIKSYHSTVNKAKEVGQKNNSQLESAFNFTKYRNYSRRRRKSWFGFKPKYFNVVEPGAVGPKRTVSDSIRKPSYADSGVEQESESKVQILNSDGVDCMRQSSSLARIVLDEVGKHIKVGVTTDDLDALAHTMCMNFGAYPSPLNYRGFPKSICTSVNNIACHGIPDNRKLENGDIISVDVSVYYNGFHGDCAHTYCVGTIDEYAQKLIDVAALCLEKAINICHHDQSFYMIGKTISKYAEDEGFSVIPAFCGHGISSKFHCPPSILHYDNKEGGVMEKGMIFTIEPVICEGKPDILILEDGWTATTEDNSRSAQFEHTILITETGAEILTIPNAFKID